MVGLVGLGR